ncbi:hypothetical protein [Streptomyces sp. NPDC095613]|uniref:hypothetical protein n=1 Tax=Streptomyces sp. NPDC095613 TaxID=3155540 RepID=UPI00331D3660
MLTAVFQGHESFVVFAAALTLLTGGLFHRKARARADRPLTIVLVAAINEWL